jgi:hypothetical protein
MSQPTAEQLAPNIDPAVRDYIEAYVREVVAKARIEAKTNTANMVQLATHMETRLAELEHFEREVRSHLGIFIPE